MSIKKSTTATAAAVLAALIATPSVFAAGFGGTTTNEAPMMRGDSANTGNGWNVKPLLTVGEGDTTNNFNTDNFGFDVPGILDGLGAYLKNRLVVRVLANQELGNTAGYEYTINAGTPAELTLPGARISYFDINRFTRGVMGAGPAIERIYNRAGDLVTNRTQLDYAALNRACSATLFEAHQFGQGRGFEDRVFLSNEETSSSFGGPGGTYWALDVETGNLWACPDVGRGAWENATLLDTGRKNVIALLLADDFGTTDSAFANDPAPPLYLYVGEKTAIGSKGPDKFLRRNGLEGGQLYVFVSDSGERDARDFAGCGNSIEGRWVPVMNFDATNAGVDVDANAATGVKAGSGYTGAEPVGADFTDDGYAVDATLRIQAGNVGAFLFSRPEDIATNPKNGAQAVLNSTGVTGLFDSADTWGTIYLIDVDFRFRGSNFDPARSTTNIKIVYDGNDAGNEDFGIRSPDNLEWAKDGYIYVQEDRAISSSLFGAASGVEASMYQLDPRTCEAVRILEMDRSAVPAGQTDGSPTDLGNWESSGVVDVSHLFPTGRGETLLLFDIQAHSVRVGDLIQNAVNADGNRNTSLVEGSQLLFASKKMGSPGRFYRQSDDHENEQSDD